MPEQLPVIPLSMLLANSQYVKQSHYTPRRKRTRSAGRQAPAQRKQPVMNQPVRAPSPKLNGSRKQAVPVIQHPVPQTKQYTFVSVQITVQNAYWQEEEAVVSRPVAAPPNWPPLPPQQAQSGWEVPPPPPIVSRPAATPQPDESEDWVLVAIVFVVALICGFIASCLFAVIF
jgi:hypothetical protein